MPPSIWATLQSCRSSRARAWARLRIRPRSGVRSKSCETLATDDVQQSAHAAPSLALHRHCDYARVEDGRCRVWCKPDIGCERHLSRPDPASPARAGARGVQRGVGLHDPTCRAKRHLSTRRLAKAEPKGLSHRYGMSATASCSTPPSRLRLLRNWRSAGELAARLPSTLQWGSPDRPNEQPHGHSARATL
jgi:hypothetical protein